MGTAVQHGFPIPRLSELRQAVLRLTWWEREMAHQTGTLALTLSGKENSDEARLHAVDVEVGRRVRNRRLQLRMSQAALGSDIGISFQQIQKYESGVNRVSCSVLYQIADTLDVPMSYFFETLPCPGRGNSERFIVKADERIDFVATSEGQRLVDAFVALPQRIRSKFIALLVAFEGADF